MVVFFVVAAASAQDQKPPAASASTELKATPEAKAALDKMDKLLDRAADKGLKELQATFTNGDTHGSPTTVKLTFTAPATFKPDAPVGRDKGFGYQVVGTVRAAMNGMWPHDGETGDVELTKKNGNDVLVILWRGKDGATTQTEHTLGASGLPASTAMIMHWTASGVERERTFGSKYTWEKAGDKYRLSKHEATFGDGMGSSIVTITYTVFNGMTIPTSWTTEVPEVGGHSETRMTELSINGKSIELKKAGDEEPAKPKPKDDK
jgi:hypothetical protein